MNILIFNWRDINNPEAGGAEVHLHKIFYRIAAKGHKVVLVSSKFPGCKSSEIVDGINIIRIGNKFNFNFAAPIYYLRKLRKERFDIVIDDISKIPICTPLYVKKPLIAIVHHIHGKTLFKELPFYFAIYIWLSEKFLIPLYKKKKIVTDSESTKEELMGMDIPEKNIIVINFGYDNNGLIVSNGKFIDPLVLYIGRIKAYKQIDHLVKAFKIVRDNIENSKLIIAGKGEKEFLRKIVAELNLDSSVEFYNEVSEAEKQRLLHDAWIFATPSMKEGWGITVIEANACGTPAVGYDVPGLRDSIKHGYNGLLARKGDIKSLANIMTDILKDKTSRNILGRNAIEWSKRFSWEKSSEEFLRVIER